VAPSTNIGYTVSLFELLAVTVNVDELLDAVAEVAPVT
jgi:hypothetical protein